MDEAIVDNKGMKSKGRMEYGGYFVRHCLTNTCRRVSVL